MNLPIDLKYTKDHEWIRAEGEIATIGITEFAQKELGDIVYIEIETLGQSLKKEEAFGTIEAVKTVSDMFMPVSGEIIEVNPLLEKNPETANKDPYGDGWMVKIRMNNPAELNELFNATDYGKTLE